VARRHAVSGPERLAVYGTLVPGGSNAHVLADLAGEWATGTLRGRRLDDGWQGYPGLVLDPAGERVRVHVLSSPALPGAWSRLDAFEGPGYRRVVVDVELGDGSVVAAQVYVLVDPPGAPG